MTLEDDSRIANLTIQVDYLRKEHADSHALTQKANARAGWLQKILGWGEGVEYDEVDRVVYGWEAVGRVAEVERELSETKAKLSAKELPGEVSAENRKIARKLLDDLYTHDLGRNGVIDTLIPLLATRVEVKAELPGELTDEAIDSAIEAFYGLTPKDMDAISLANRRVSMRAATPFLQYKSREIEQPSEAELINARSEMLVLKAKGVEWSDALKTVITAMLSPSQPPVDPRIAEVLKIANGPRVPLETSEDFARRIIAAAGGLHRIDGRKRVSQ